MTGMVHNESFMTHAQRAIKMKASGMQITDFLGLLLISAILGIGLIPAIYTLISLTIRSDGQIGSTMIATSGYWQDIQAAVDRVAARGDIGNVYIPEGTFNFVEVGESWTGARVNIPAGVNLFGAPTARTSGLPYNGVGQNPNDQAIAWRTVLIMPWDVPGNDSIGKPIWFNFIGTGDPANPSRFSDIKLVGYRNFNQSATNFYVGIRFSGVQNYRVDHVYLRDICGDGIESYYSVSGKPSSGVIDHSYLVNTVGIPAPYDLINIGYGVHATRASGDLWEENLGNVLGQYLSYSVYIEDSYFEKWRHNVASNTGAHYVFRHNTILHDYDITSVDAHGWFQTACANPSHGTLTNPSAAWNGTDWTCSVCGAPLRSTRAESSFYITQVGTRAVEIYNNSITDAVDAGGGGYSLTMRGGAGVVFNNIAGGGAYATFLYLWNDADQRPEGSKVWINGFYVWNNTIGILKEITKYDPNNHIVENVNYFRNSPPFTYSSYLYPHPLTLETSQP